MDKQSKDLSTEIKELKQELRRKRDNIKKYLLDTPLKSKEHALNEFLFSRWLIPYKKELAKKKRLNSSVEVTPLPIDMALSWLNQDFTDMKWPLLHVYGGTGTGKSHFCRGFIRYILLNKFAYDQYYSYSIECIDWHGYVQSVKDSFNSNSEPREIDWQADIMLIEDIDRQACTSTKGSTYSLELMLPQIKNRLEIERKPTILISYRNATELTKFLATDIAGNKHESAKQMAQDMGNLIGNTMYSGLSRGSDFRAEIRGNKQYYSKIVVSGLKNQDIADIFELSANYGMELEW